MKKKLLVLLIAIIPTLIPNLASAVAIDVGGYDEIYKPHNGWERIGASVAEPCP